MHGTRTGQLQYDLSQPRIGTFASIQQNTDLVDSQCLNALWQVISD